MPRVYPPLEGRQPTNNISPSIIQFVAGGSAGIVTTLVVHPFDVIKTRLQIEQNDGQHLARRRGASLRVIKQIASEAVHGQSPDMPKAPRGKFTRSADTMRAFYRGLMPNMIGNSVSWALYFMWYNQIKAQIETTRYGGKKDIQLSSSEYFFASGTSGVMTAVFTNPIWVIKTRMLSTAKDAPGAYKSILSGTTMLYKSEGIKGFYRGLVPSLIGVSHGAIQFMVYEQLQNRVAPHRKGGKEGLTVVDTVQLSATAKALAGTITYPYQVVRSRLQTYDAAKRYSGAWDVVTKVFKNEGLAGFYKGLGPNLIRVVPSTCVTFVVYENVRFYLPRMWDDKVADVDA